MVVSLARKSECDSDLTNAIAQKVLSMIAHFVPCDLSNVVVAYAKMHQQSTVHTELFVNIADHTSRHIGEFGCQELASVIWV